MRIAFILVTLLLLSVVAVPADSIESTEQLENQAPHCSYPIVEHANVKL